MRFTVSWLCRPGLCLNLLHKQGAPRVWSIQIRLAEKLVSVCVCVYVCIWRVCVSVCVCVCVCVCGLPRNIYMACLKPEHTSQYEYQIAENLQVESTNQCHSLHTLN